MLIDSHCHLHDREFFTEVQAEEMVTRAKNKNVRKIVCIGTSHADSLVARDFAKSYKGVYWTYGIHPGETTGSTDPSGRLPLSIQQKSDLLTNIDEWKAVQTGRLVAIGEVGLDYHYGGYNREAQIELFETMLQLAKDKELPVSFHVREAFDDFFGVVKNFPEVRGVVHSFSDNKKNLRKILNETDFYIGVNGMATYSTLPTPPLDRIVLETDAPFLTPKQFRGIINEPAYIPEIASWLAEKIGEKIEIIEKETTNNATKLFNFQDSFLHKA